jgi:hypothetical protein
MAEGRVEVLMFRANSEAGRDLFSCEIPGWHFLQTLGHAFGWQPVGTSYSQSAPPKSDVVVRHDYEPGERADLKQVDREDALEWARALAKAKRSEQFVEMLRTSSNPVSPHAATAVSLSTLVDEFTEYAFGGAFTFSLAHKAELDVRE